MSVFRKIAAACLLVPFASWPAFAQAPKLEKTHLAIAVGGSISQMNKVAYTMALHRKYFEQEGLTVDSSAFASGTAALQSLIGGSADVAEGAFEHTLRLQTKGVGLTCLATFGRYPGNVLVVKKSQADKIKSVKDLVGKKIGVSAPGASTHNFVAGLMTRAGIDWNKASYLSIGTGPSAVAAMRSGSDLDALVNLDPAINSLVDNGDAVILSDSRTEAGTKEAFGGPYLADCLMVKNEFLKANPNTSQAIANAIVHAMQWLKTASIDDIITSLPPEYYKADEKTYRESLAKNISAFQWDGIVSNEAAKNVWDSISVLEPQFKAAKVDVTVTHDNKLIETALKKYHSPVKN
ncbi:MAG TPA: ABC transporter substrate-binding protein [Pseudolabrys sp.]|jgi:sulfonate transport system substrate-binding protein|nr:ABC transporter substrate-binding protein [Pseudolabrys sp.]